MYGFENSFILSEHANAEFHKLWSPIIYVWELGLITYCCWHTMESLAWTDEFWALTTLGTSGAVGLKFQEHLEKVKSYSTLIL